MGLGESLPALGAWDGDRGRQRKRDGGLSVQKARRRDRGLRVGAWTGTYFCRPTDRRPSLSYIRSAQKSAAESKSPISLSLLDPESGPRRTRATGADTEERRKRRGLWGVLMRRRRKGLVNGGTTEDSSSVFPARKTAVQQTEGSSDFFLGGILLQIRLSEKRTTFWGEIQIQGEGKLSKSDGRRSVQIPPPPVFIPLFFPFLVHIHPLHS